MEALSKEIEKIGHGISEADCFAKIEKILQKQEYPVDVDWYLKMISEKIKWPWNIIRAYQLGVIAGKRCERAKNKCGNGCGKKPAKH